MLSITVEGAWTKARPASLRPAELPWGVTTPAEQAASAAWQAGNPLDVAGQSAWDQVAPLDAATQGEWERAALADHAPQAARWDAVPPLDFGVHAMWDRSIRPRDVRLRLIYNPKPARKDADLTGTSRRVDEHGPRYDAAAELRASLYIPSLPLAFSFGGRPYFPPTSPLLFFDFRYRPPRPRIQPTDSGAAPAWGTARQINQLRSLLWGWGVPRDPVPTGITYPDYAGPVIIVDPPAEPDILETYMIANTVSLVVLPERTPLDATDIQVSLDIDSFSWVFSCGIQGQTSLNLVRPDAGGQKEVELEINGWRWVLLIERYSRALQFPAERYTVTGASRSQLLAGPYAPKRSAMNAEPITARQAAEEQLLYTGFTIEWDSANSNPPDWTLPPGALTYQDQTPMEVIARLATAVGGVVRPSRDSDELTVLPRYREATWFWPTAIMDRIIPADIITSLDGEWTPQPAWNSCYVSGTNHGVAVDVRRVGTAGDNPAPDVYDDLLTDPLACRARGITELSKGGNIEIVGKVIPLFPAADTGNPGLVLPAMLCEVRGAGATWRGLCLSTSISATGVGASRVSQTLKLERHTGGGH